MAAVSAFFAKALLDWAAGGATPSTPAARWVGLAGGTPTSVAGSELAAGQGYFSRLSALFGAAASPAGSASITAGLTFGPFSSAGSALGVLVCTSAAIAATDFMFYGTLQTARTYILGDSLVMSAGALTITMA